MGNDIPGEEQLKLLKMDNGRGLDRAEAREVRLGPLVFLWLPL